MAHKNRKKRKGSYGKRKSPYGEYMEQIIPGISLKIGLMVEKRKLMSKKNVDSSSNNGTHPPEQTSEIICYAGGFTQEEIEKCRRDWSLY